MKTRIYLDTSVFSARYDDRAPDRMRLTEEFWSKISEFDASTAELAREELRRTPDPVRRRRLIGLLRSVIVVPVTFEMRGLAEHYVVNGIFSRASFNDAVHVAAAVLSRRDALLSWNFKHLVNRRRRAQVNRLNADRGLCTIDIVAPPEI